MWRSKTLPHLWFYPNFSLYTKLDKLFPDTCSVQTGSLEATIVQSRSHLYNLYNIVCCTYKTTMYQCLPHSEAELKTEPDAFKCICYGTLHFSLLYCECIQSGRKTSNKRQLQEHFNIKMARSLVRSLGCHVSVAAVHI